MKDAPATPVQPSLSELRADFPIVERALYMNHAATGPMPRSVAAAMQRQMDIQVTHADSGSERFAPVYRRARDRIAAQTGSRAERIAFIQNTSHGISLLANGQAWRPGDNVVVPEMEFPSNYLPWLRLEGQGVELRRAAAPEGRTTADSLAAAIDDGTRVVALSAVQYFNGYRCDLARIAELARAHDALLVVDGTQAVGAMQVDVGRSGIDALVVSAHKWMLGPLGIGFMALSDRMFARTAVTEIGWLGVEAPFEFRRRIEPRPDAARFEPGTENAAGIFGLLQRFEDIDAYGPAALETRVLGLTARLSEALRARGFTIDSPMGAGERSGILTFRHPGLDGEAMVETLKHEAMFLSFRHGAIRASPHYYNSEDEIDALVERLGDDL